MKIYMDPIPKTCSTCNLGRRVLDHAPWYTCFVTGKTSTSITTDRPDYCPIEGAPPAPFDPETFDDSESKIAPITSDAIKKNRIIK